MALTNAEKQRRWRERRNALAKDAERLRNQEGPGLRLQLDPLHIELLDLHAEYFSDLLGQKRTREEWAAEIIMNEQLQEGHGP